MTRLRILGSGTSTGVPVCGCPCAVCSSTDPKNHRLRTSLYLERLDSSGKKNGLIIDTGPDFRTQCLEAKIQRIDAVLYTHTHSDHVAGIDDLRCFNFIQEGAIPVYSLKHITEDLAQRFRYCFSPNLGYEGGATPNLSLNNLEPNVESEIAGFKVIAVPIEHGSNRIAGFRIDNIAYLTDCSGIPEKSKEYLLDLDLLIIDGLRNRPHNTHFTQAEAAREAEDLKPKKTYLTHISHEVDHHQGNMDLKKITKLDVELAYDGLELEL